MAPYPSPAVQEGVRTERPLGGWFAGVPLYPVKHCWTEAPRETWPAKLQDFTYDLKNSDSQSALLPHLRQHYPDDAELMRFADWLEWHHEAKIEVRKVWSHEL